MRERDRDMQEQEQELRFGIITATMQIVAIRSERGDLYEIDDNHWKPKHEIELLDEAKSLVDAIREKIRRANALAN